MSHFYIVLTQTAPHRLLLDYQVFWVPFRLAMDFIQANLLAKFLFTLNARPELIIHLNNILNNRQHLE